MSFLTIDGYVLKKCIIAGANLLDANKEYVDSLNVFPVPDGDTGTNMSLTTMAAALEASKTNTPDIYEVAKAASSGSLRGARGNSGVILSQLFRGFAKALKGKSVANVDDLANAFAAAAETAYKAVMKPKEGTILTVAKALSEKAFQASYETDDIVVFLEEVIKHANGVLANTTNMLPQLKQAGVVDAGGQGLMYIVEGGLKAVGTDGEITLNTAKKAYADMTPFSLTRTEDIKFGYCTEFFVNLVKHEQSAEDSFKDYLQSIGDSIVMVSDDNLIKIHVHTNNPGKVLERALKIGSLENIKIENMRVQHTNKISFAATPKPVAPVQEEMKDVGFVAVSMGSGMKELLESLGVDCVIEGGQTMNPSTEDVLEAIQKVNAKDILVLPNNKNIILAAEQAAKLTKDKQVHIIPSKMITQGISVLIHYIPDSIENVLQTANESIKNVCTGQITYAVRDTMLDEKEIKQGNILCMIENKIEIVCEDLDTGCIELVEKLIAENADASFISIYYGQDVTEAQANSLVEFITENYSSYDVELHFGNQPLYYYIISIE